MPLHLILTLLACSIPCSSAFAARLLNYTISQGGQPLVRGIYSDDGLQPRDAVWSFAKSVQFRIVPHAKFPLKSPTDLECKLEGPVDIRVQHTSTDLIAVTIKGLTLVRPDSSSRDWTLKERGSGTSRRPATGATGGWRQVGKLECMGLVSRPNRTVGDCGCDSDETCASKQCFGQISRHHLRSPFSPGAPGGRGKHGGAFLNCHQEFLTILLVPSQRLATLILECCMLLQAFVFALRDQ